MRDKERVELKIIVGESINRLSSLDGLTIDIYEKEVLPKLIQIILESNDVLSQQYLMECIIHAFSDSYNIKCIELILNTLSRLLPGVDIKGLFINLMEKLAKFITDNSGEDATEEEILNNDDKVHFPLAGIITLAVLVVIVIACIIVLFALGGPVS